MNKLIFMKRLVKGCTRIEPEKLSFSTLFSTSQRFLSIASSTETNEQPGKEVQSHNPPNLSQNSTKTDSKTFKVFILLVFKPFSFII